MAMEKGLLEKVKVAFQDAADKMADIAKRAQAIEDGDDLAPELIMNLHSEVETAEEGLERICKKYSIEEGGVMICGDW